VKKYYIMQELSNHWESWKFFFILKKEENDDQLNLNQKLKESKVRDYLFHILDKVITCIRFY